MNELFLNMKKCISTVLSLFLFCLIIFSCGEIRKVSEYGLSVTKIHLETYDTISVKVLNDLINNNELPPLDKWQKTELTNYEENKEHMFYFYYDKEKEKMMSLKRLVNEKDTAYVFVKKMVKFED